MTTTAPQPSASKVPAPPPLVRRWIRVLLGLSVGVGVGLAPFLGKVNVPGFDSLLSLFPETLRGTMLPLASLLMSVIAVVIQFFDGETFSKARIMKLFSRTIGALVTLVFAFVILYSSTVVPVPIRGGKEYARFAVGFGERPSACNDRCQPQLSDSECIKEVITLDPTKIESCWGTKRVQMANTWLILSYLLMTSAFGASVGLVLLRNTWPDKKKKQA